MNTNQPGANDLGRQAMDQGPSAAADRLETAAAALREGVAGLPGGERVKDFARGATDRLSRGADFIRSRDPAADEGRHQAPGHQQPWCGTRRGGCVRIRRGASAAPTVIDENS